jgi:hypothetical protein
MPGCLLHLSSPPPLPFPSPSLLSLPFPRTVTPTTVFPRTVSFTTISSNSVSPKKYQKNDLLICVKWPQGTVFFQLPDAVISTADHPLGSPALLRKYLVPFIGAVVRVLGLPTPLLQTRLLLLLLCASSH